MYMLNTLLDDYKKNHLKITENEIILLVVLI